MTPQEEWKHLVWRRWLRMTLNKSTTQMSGDIILRPYERRTIADAVDTIDRMRNQPTAIDTLFKK